MTQHDYQQQAKTHIVQLIDTIWGKGAIRNNHADNINEDVAQVLDDTINQIKHCSKQMILVDVMYNFLYTKPTSINEILFGMVADSAANLVEDPEHNRLRTYLNWIALLRGHRQYKTCIHTAALAHRTRLEAALMGEGF